MNALTTTDAAPFVPGTGLVPRNMDEALRLAEFMARARTVPKHLQDSPGDCLMVIEQAMRWGMSPFAVAQATSVISGKMMHEGKLVAAAVETSGAIVGHIDYSFTGEGDTRAVTVSATRRGETNPRTVSVTFREARTNNEMWKRQPDQQLVYHGARVWARRWTPAVILGVYSREEMGVVIEGEFASDEPVAPIRTARDAINDSIPLRSAAAAAPRAERKVDAKVYDTAPDPRWDNPTTEKPQRTDEQWRVWIDKLRAACAVLRHRQEVVEIGNKPSVGDAIASAPDWAQREISAILAENYARFPAEPGDDLDEVAIKGEEHLAAG